MIRAIVWKELREQGLIALALVVLGSGVLAAAAILADPPTAGASPSEIIKYLGIGRLATLMLAVTAGIVCGGAVFAAEREAGTFAFLDSLPTTRRKIWSAKFAAGLGLAATQIVLLIAAAAAMGMVPSTGWAVAVALYSLLAFVWGMLGSTAARTTLGSVGIAIPAATLTAILVLLPIMILFPSPGSNFPRPTGAFLFLTLMFVIPLGLSAWMFTSLDRARSADDVSPVSLLPAAVSRGAVPDPQGSTAPRRSRLGAAALLWLTIRQSALTAVVLSGFALLFGLALLLPGAQPFLTWPALALTAGVVAGVTTFADEQTRGSARFWGEQRLPVGRVWAFKVGAHFALCLWLLMVLALPMAVRSQLDDPSRGNRGHTLLASTFRVPLFDELGSQTWKYLVVPAVYGFAAGHLCGLVFRKLVVACGVASIVGGVGAVAWGPSLLAGGVKHWQLWLPPAVALGTGWFLMRAWTADRMAGRAALIRLGGGCAAGLAIMAAGLTYRIVEIPDVPDGEQDIEYVNSLPPLDENAGGRDFRTAADRFARLATTVSPPFDRTEPANPTAFRQERVEERLDRVPRGGWPDQDEALDKWLSEMYRSAPIGTEDATWYATATVAAAAPIGIYEYPQLVGVTGNTGAPLFNARRMANAILARGLQRQAAGDSADFPERLRITLALARTMKKDTVFAGYLGGAEVERSALSALDNWLARLPADSKLTRSVIPLLDAAEPTEPFDPRNYFLAERFVLREGLKAPAQWLPNLLTLPGGNPDAVTSETDMVGMAWAVPWERERTRRIIGLGFESGLPDDPFVVLGRPGLGILIGRARNVRDIIDIDRLMSVHRRVSRVKLALRAYRADTGAYPPTLAALVSTGYLRALPTDPYQDKSPFGYRLTKDGGETLVAPPRLPNERAFAYDVRTGGQIVPAQPEQMAVPAGQPILWSVGSDRIDQGGKNIPVGFSLTLVRPPDIVYLVPVGKNP